METAPFLVVVWGDSIAASGWCTPAEFAHNVALNTGRPIKMINEGVGGMPAAKARTQFEDRVLKHKPDLVIIQFGFNDQRHDGSRGALPLSTPEEFASHLREMIRRCREEAKARVLVLGNHRCRAFTILPTGRTYDQTRELYNHIAFNAAREAGVDFLDMSRALQSAPEIPWHAFVNEDGVHLTPLGLQAYAGITSTAISQIIRGEPVRFV